MMDTRRFNRFDLVIAIGLIAFFVAVPLSGGGQQPSPGNPSVDARGYALLVATGAFFALRGRLPLVYFGGTLLATGVFIALGYPAGPSYLAPFIAQFLVIAATDRRFWAPVVVVGALGTGGLSAMRPDSQPFDVVFKMLLWIAACAAAITVVSLLRQRAELAERSYEQDALRRVGDERLRIAQEVHDVVAHSLATISLQAGVAAHLLRGRDDPAQTALLAIRGVSNDALTELRSVLGLLRDAEAAPDPPLAPTSGLADVGDLVTAMRAAGLRIDDRIDTDGAEVSELVSFASYRIIQEALTNAARHAGAHARVLLRVAELGAAVEIEIRNDLPVRDTPQRPGSGSGIMGMRERATAVGGSFTAGYEPDGEFRTWALLPTTRRA